MKCPDFPTWAGVPELCEGAPRCPVCRRETDTLFLDRAGEIVGCGECVCRADAWDLCRRAKEA